MASMANRRLALVDLKEVFEKNIILSYLCLLGFVSVWQIRVRLSSNPVKFLDILLFPFRQIQMSKTIKDLTAGTVGGIAQVS